MALGSLLLSALILFLVFLLSALPLYFAVQFLGGKTTLLKTAFVSLIAGVIVSAIRYYFETWGGIIGFFILIWIYHEVFRLKWLKALFAWLLQFVFLAIFYLIGLLIAGAIVGISILALL